MSDGASPSVPLPVVIGVDVGTTAVKAVAVAVGSPTAPGGTLRTDERTYPLREPEPGRQVQDPVALLAAVDGALAACVAGLGERAADVVGLSLATAMHALVGLDADGAPLTSIITWADARASEEAAELRQRAAELLERTGTAVHPLSPMVKLRWFARHEPELGVAHWVSLKDLLVHHLTGELVTETSTASATGLYDLRAGRWDPEAMELAGVTAELLPPVRATTDQLPLARAVPGLAPGLPVVLGATDGPLGNLGVDAIGPGQVGVSLGTSAAARTVVAAPTFHPSLFCYALADGAWVVGAAVSNGAVVLDWLARTTGTDVPTLLAEAAQVPAGADGVVVEPGLLPERPPGDPDATGEISGLRMHHGRGHLARAAVEGVCRRVARVIDTIAEVAPVEQVLATGGALRSPLWEEVLEQVLGREVTVVEAEAGSGLGAAALGAYALGLAPSLGEARIAVG